MTAAKLSRRGGLGRRAPAIVTLSVAIGLGPGLARPHSGRDGQPLRYAAAQLDCARFRESSRSEVTTYVAGHTRRETVGLDGEWRFRAALASGDSVHLEGWLDTLALWRRAEQDSLEPDTDGIIGGRYRGLLSPDGRYRGETTPFVPDPLLEVADLARALDDLLPRLPPRLPAVGETWSDGAGLEIRRLADSSAAEPIYRFRLTLRLDVAEAALRGDSLPLKLRQSIREDGEFAWGERQGLLHRERRVDVETYVPAEARVGRPVQARIEQRVLLERLERGC